MSRPRLFSAVLLAGAALVPTGIASAGTVTMSGSTSVFPLASQLASKYKGFNKSFHYRIFQGGSDIGISDVARGRVTIGDASRDPTDSDPGGITFNKIARDAVCVATNPANRLGNLSQEQIQAIFSGRIRDWSDVPGSTVKGPITLVVRNAASGTQDAFQNIFMGQDLRVASSASQKTSNGLVQQAVRSSQNKTAIGYVSFKFTSGLNPVSYQGVGCSLRNAKSGQYGGTRNFWMVTRGKASGLAKSFINWIRTNSTAKRITAGDWVPLR